MQGEVLAISGEAQEDQQALQDELQLTFPVLHDGTGRVAPHYGGLREGTTMPNPATFVVDQEGRIRFRLLGHGSGDPPLVEQVLRVLEELENRAP